MSIFKAAHGCGGKKDHPLPQFCHTYPIMMKLGAAIEYPKNM